MTFGQPMTVNKDLAASLDSQIGDKYVYFINDMDPVARAVEPYVHFGFMVHYVDGKIIKSDPPLLKYSATGDDYETPQSIDTLSDAELDQVIRDLEEAEKPLSIRTAILWSRASFLTCMITFSIRINRSSMHWSMREEVARDRFDKGNICKPRCATMTFGLGKEFP